MAISYSKQHIDQNDIKSVLRVLRSNFITQGPKIVEFETVLKKRFGSKYCRVVSSGTAALHLSALALGWKSKDIILTSPITFLASVNAITYVGATVDLVDINPVTYTIDVNKLEDKIKKYKKKGKKIKAIIGVDYAGHPCDWKSLRDIANKYNLQLINDNCHALGSSYFGNNKYATKYADIVTHSYHPVKHITTGEGGSILTNSNLIDDKIFKLRSHGIKKKHTIKPWYYEMHDIGYNYRITDIQCALGISQLKKLSNFVFKRRRIAKIYDNAFKDLTNFIIPKENEKIKHSYHLYPLQVEFDKFTIKKSAFFKMMQKNTINLQVHYIPIHFQPYYKKKYNFKIGDFPIAENFYKNEFSIPVYPDLNLNTVNFIIKKIKKFLVKDRK